VKWTAELRFMRGGEPQSNGRFSGRSSEGTTGKCNEACWLNILAWIGLRAAAEVQERGLTRAKMRAWTGGKLGT
jgi:hypothetical protein